MQALRKINACPGVELVVDESKPTAGAGEVVVAVKAAGICGSDMHAYEWTSSYAFMTNNLPVTLGHEFSGVIVEVGEGVSDSQLGQRVTVWPTVGCGVCVHCESGAAHLCSRRQTIGLHADGGFAERVRVPARNCVPIPDEIEFKLAALTEPLCVAADAVEGAGIVPGEPILVLGPGPIGLGLAWFARAAGADPVIVAGKSDAARLACAGDMGFNHLIDLDEDDLTQSVSRMVDGGIACVFEATGIPQSVHDGLAVLRRGGRVVVTGIHAEPLSLDLTQLVRGRHNILTSHDSRLATWPRVLDVLSRHGDTLSRLISQQRSLGEAVEAFELAGRRETVKVLLNPGGSSTST